MITVTYNSYERHYITNTVDILLHLKAAETYLYILFGSKLLYVLEHAARYLNQQRYSWIFIQENVCENVSCEMAAIFSRPQFVKNFPNVPLLYADVPWCWSVVISK